MSDNVPVDIYRNSGWREPEEEEIALTPHDLHLQLQQAEEVEVPFEPYELDLVTDSCGRVGFRVQPLDILLDDLEEDETY